MRWSWALGFVLAGLVVVGALVWLYSAWRARSARDAAVDLMLDDLDATSAQEPRRRRGEFIDDTSPAVLSMRPELEPPEWGRQKKRR